MIITSDILRCKLKNYSNKSNKINREVKKGNLIKIKKGLYETNPNTSGYLLATAIYGPSYFSFDFALYYYGLIPEKVVSYTSATLEKRKKKEYSTPFGKFYYRDVPSKVYYIGIRLVEEENYSYQIATPEKAMCDKLYTIRPVHNQKELICLLFDDLRIDKTEIKKFDIELVKKISELYHCTNVNLFYKYLRSCNNE